MSDKILVTSMHWKHQELSEVLFTDGMHRYKPVGIFDLSLYINFGLYTLVSYLLKICSKEQLVYTFQYKSTREILRSLALDELEIFLKTYPFLTIIPYDDENDSEMLKLFYKKSEHKQLETKGILMPEVTNPLSNLSIQNGRGLESTTPKPMEEDKGDEEELQLSVTTPAIVTKEDVKKAEAAYLKYVEEQSIKKAKEAEKIRAFVNDKKRTFNELFQMYKDMNEVDYQDENIKIVKDKLTEILTEKEKMKKQNIKPSTPLLESARETTVNQPTLTGASLPLNQEVIENLKKIQKEYEKYKNEKVYKEPRYEMSFIDGELYEVDSDEEERFEAERNHPMRLTMMERLLYTEIQQINLDHIKKTQNNQKLKESIKYLVERIEMSGSDRFKRKHNELLSRRAKLLQDNRAKKKHLKTDEERRQVNFDADLQYLKELMTEIIDDTYILW